MTFAVFKNAQNYFKQFNILQNNHRTPKEYPLFIHLKRIFLKMEQFQNDYFSNEY